MKLNKFSKIIIGSAFLIPLLSNAQNLLTLDANQQEALDRLTSGAAARYTIAVTCKESYQPQLLEQIKQRLFQRAISLGFQKDQTISYVEDTIDRKLKALSIAYSERNCTQTQNLKILAINYGFWD